MSAEIFTESFTTEIETTKRMKFISKYNKMYLHLFYSNDVYKFPRVFN